MNTPAPTRRLRRITRFGLVLGSLLGALGLSEAALRFVGFEYHLYPEHIQFGYPDPEVLENYFRPHDRYLWVRQDYDERVARAKERRPHLVLTGDSCTELGLFDTALRRRVKHTPDAKRLRLSNLAVSGWSTYQGLEQIKLDVVALNPEVVTIFFGWNDHWMGFGVEDKTAARLTASPFLMQLQKLRFFQLLSKTLVFRDQRRHGPGARPERVSLGDFRSNLTQMVEVAREHDIVPVLLTAPTTHKAGEEPEYLGDRWLEDLSELVPLHQRYVDVVRDVAREEGVVLCDLAAAFARLERADALKLMKEDGIHFTEAGGAFVGSLLHRCLAENQLLP